MVDYTGAHTGAEVDDGVGVTKGAGTGLVAKTGTGTGAKRTITGTANQIDVADGDGVSGNPTLSLPSAVTDILTGADLSGINTSILDNLTIVAQCWGNPYEGNDGAWMADPSLSWYSDNGAFPSVVLAALEADALYIYDAAGATLDLWDTVDLTGYTATSVVVIAGQIVIGTTTGVIVLDYAGDDTEVAPKYTTSTSPAIVNNAVSAVAATILPDAPIDPVTGHKVPTIAVATGGGVSIVNNDGTVADSTQTVGMLAVAFGDNNRLFYSDDGSDQVYYADTYAADGFNSGGTHYDTDAAPFTLPGNVADMAGNAFGHADGLTFLHEDQSTKASGMTAFATKDYNAGWMQGDCELALCDGLTDRSAAGTTVTDNGTAVVADIASGSDQQKITASGGSITAPVTTGGAIYGWELVSSIWYFRAGTGWVGVSEAAGTLTIADGTTFAMLRYTNGSGPSADQYTLMEAREKPLTLADTACLIYGTSDAVLGVAYDKKTGLLYVLTSDGVSVFKGLVRVSYDASAAGAATVAAMNGFVSYA